MSSPAVMLARPPNSVDGSIEKYWMVPPRLLVEATPSEPMPCDSSAPARFSAISARAMLRPL
ncbi:hypothetical protein D3C71_1144840 [compost metagenome]